jgi:hypothetical protein
MSDCAIDLQKHVDENRGIQSEMHTHAPRRRQRNVEKGISEARSPSSVARALSLLLGGSG